jgi:hypothetical protein
MAAARRGCVRVLVMRMNLRRRMPSAIGANTGRRSGLSLSRSRVSAVRPEGPAMRTARLDRCIRYWPALGSFGGTRGRLTLARRTRRETAVGGTMFAVLVAACVPISAAPSNAVSAAPAASTPPPESTLRNLVAHGAKVKEFASGLGYAEGPLWLPDGRLIVSDVTNDVVLAFDAAGHKSVFRRPSNVANGHALDADGAVLEAEAGDNTHHPLVARLAAAGTATVLADKYRGEHLNEPNDLISDTASNDVESFPVTANDTVGRPKPEFGEGWPVRQAHRRDPVPRRHQQSRVGRHRRQDPVRHHGGGRRVQPRSDGTGDPLNRAERCTAIRRSS